jgi:hypothetical protein
VFSDDTGSAGSAMTTGTKYVSNSGDDTNNGDTALTPYRRIHKAANALRLLNTGIILIPAAQAFVESADSLISSGVAPIGVLYIRPDTGGTSANTSVTMNSNDLRNGAGDFRFVFEDLTVYVDQNNSISGAPEVAFRRCIIDSHAATEYNNALRAPIFLTDATYTAATKTVTKTAAFASYTWVTGDKIWLWGTGTTAGQYTIASKASDNAITLVEALAAGDLGAVVKTPYFTLGYLASTIAHVNYWDCKVKAVSFVNGMITGASSFGTLLQAPEADMIRGAGSHQCWGNNLGGGAKYTDNHLDGYQSVSDDQNSIIRNFAVVGAPVQGILINRQDSGNVGGIAVTNGLIVQSTLGSYLTQIGSGLTTDCARFWFQNLSLPNQGLMFRPANTPGSFRNITVLGCVSLALSSKQASDSSDSRSWGIRYVHSHSINGLGQVGQGQRYDVTTGDAGFTDGTTGSYDVGAIDYRPDADSELLDRITPPLRVIDLAGVSVSSPDAVGAFVSSEAQASAPFGGIGGGCVTAFNSYYYGYYR